MRWVRANRRADRIWKETKAHGDALYREINHYICEYDRGDEREWRLQHKPVVKSMQAKADAELEDRWHHYDQVCDRKTQEWRKLERYCRQQREHLRALEDLHAKERAMYELNQAKDQVMTICTLALTNLAMWVRDHYFPAEYAHATWHRLAPFFRLPGRITYSPKQGEVALHPFNDRRLNRDLVQVCERLAATPLCLPSGGSLSNDAKQDTALPKAAPGISLRNRVNTRLFPLPVLGLQHLPVPHAGRVRQSLRLATDANDFALFCQSLAGQSATPGVMLESTCQESYNISHVFSRILTGGDP